jgi:hypothetical protein
MVTEPLDCGDLWSVIYETYPFNVSPPYLILLNGKQALTLTLALTPAIALALVLALVLALTVHMEGAVYCLSISVLTFVQYST